MVTNIITVAASMALLSVICLAAPDLEDLTAVLDQLIISARRSPNPGFWLTTIDNTVEQCSPEYLEKLAKNFNETKGGEDPEMIKMYDQLERRVFKYCNRKFLPCSKEVIDACTEVSDCRHATNGYSVGLHWVPRWDSYLAMAVARIMKRNAGVQVESQDEFNQAYSQKGPCKVVFDRLDQDDMRDYSRYFLRLVSKLRYYNEFDNQHRYAADIVAACRHLGGLLQQAYNRYKTLI